MLHSITEMSSLVLEVGAENPMAQEELSKGKSPCSPHLLVSGELLNSVLELLLLLKLTLPATARGEGVLATLPFDLLLIGCVGCGRLLREFVFPIGGGCHLRVHGPFAEESWDVLARGRGRSDVATRLGWSVKVDQVVRANSLDAPSRAASLLASVGRS